MPEKVLKLLVVEDHPIYLEGLSYILKKLSNNVILTCVYRACDAQELLSKDNDFDLLLLDLSLPDGDGMLVLKYLMNKKIFIPVVILSASEEPRDLKYAIKSGASGYISKVSSSAEILSAIKKILSGENYFPDFYSKPSCRPQAIKEPSLTPRQHDVLRLIIEGLPNKKICQRLNLTDHTVKSHLKALFTLLNVHNRTQCARVATDLRLLD